MIKRIILIALCIANFSAITILSTQSSDKSNELSKNVTERIISPMTAEMKIEEKVLIDNDMTRDIAHFTLFLTLSILVSLKLKNFNIKRMLVYTFIICFIYAVFDEVCQELLQQGRAFEFADLLKDWAGSAVGIVLMVCINNLKFKVKNRSYYMM